MAIACAIRRRTSWTAVPWPRRCGWRRSSAGPLSSPRSKDGGYGLLLDPQRQTVTQIAGGDGGALTLHVDTKEVSWHLPRKGDGHIALTYTLLLGTQALSALHLALTLTKEEKDA